VILLPVISLMAVHTKLLNCACSRYLIEISSLPLFLLLKSSYSTNNCRRGTEMNHYGERTLVSHRYTLFTTVEVQSVLDRISLPQTACCSKDHAYTNACVI